MKSFKLFLLATLLIISSCKEDAATEAKKESPFEPSLETPAVVDKLQLNSTLYFIRHAEKVTIDVEDIDPELTQIGLGRAMHWAEILNEIPLDAIYSTDFTRTSMTAAPTSVKQNVDVAYYDLKTIDILDIAATHTNGNVLVVGHSSTIPAFVNQLLGEEKYNALEELEYGALFTVTIIEGVVVANKLAFNCSLN